MNLLSNRREEKQQQRTNTKTRNKHSKEGTDSNITHLVLFC